MEMSRLNSIGDQDEGQVFFEGTGGGGGGRASLSGLDGRKLAACSIQSGSRVGSTSAAAAAGRLSKDETRRRMLSWRKQAKLRKASADVTECHDAVEQENKKRHWSVTGAGPSGLHQSFSAAAVQQGPTTTSKSLIHNKRRSAPPPFVRQRSAAAASVLVSSRADGDNKRRQY